MIPFNSEIVKCDNLAELMHELSNMGARDEFGKLVEELIVPTLVTATQKGEREIRLGNTPLILISETIIKLYNS